MLLVVLGAITVVVGLGLLRYRPWASTGDKAPAPGAAPRERLTVGFLPVT